MNIDTKQSLFDLCKKYNDVFVVDMFNYIFKYYFANKDLSVTRDEKVIPTGHFFGITRQMIFLKEHFPNCAIVFAIDGHDMTRREINEEYKAGRVHEIEPAEYVNEIVMMCSLIDGVYSCYNPNYEADDVIGSVSTTLKSLCERNNIEKNIYILSSDKDMYQLITDEGKCKIRAIKKFGYGQEWYKDIEFIDENKVREVFNDVSPKDLVKFRAITGDSSDNLKGYFRFRKANASIIANNFEYIQSEHKLVLKKDVPMRESWRKPLETILEDFSIFEKNYAIMKLKMFDFDIVADYKSLSFGDVKSIMDMLYSYEMNMYINTVGRFSPHRDIIEDCNRSVSDADNVIDTIKEDLASLL